MSSSSIHIRTLWIALCFAVLCLSHTAFASLRDTTKVSILFVGNSLTYANELPKLVARLARDDGYKVKTEMLALPDYALVDHWNEGKLQKRIATGKFDFVVVQQGPSSQEEGRQLLIDYAEHISRECKKYNAQLALYMVWPSMNYLSTFDGVIRSYTEAAQRSEAILCPVGKVWKEYMEKTGSDSNYGPDRFHPSPAGSEVAARVIWESLLAAWQAK